MRYHEEPPPPQLADWVHRVWTFEDEAGSGEPQRIVPDGRCELVVHLGEPYREAGADALQPPVLFAGQLTRPLWLEATGPVSVIGVRFRPAGARAFVAGSMRRTTDRRVALDELVPGLAFGMAQALVRLPTVDERTEALARWVGERIEQASVRDDLAVRPGAELIEATAGNVEPAGLVSASGLGRRQFERRFGDQVGVGPALLSTIFRFRRVFDVIEHGGPRPWTDAALEAGYYDQSHFIRDFRRFVGCTPSEFQQGRAGLATSLV